MRFEATPQQTWENACPRCGCLAWLHRGMIVSVRVVEVVFGTHSVQGIHFIATNEPIGARVTFGDGLRGLMQCEREFQPGDTVQAEVLQVDHEGKRVGFLYRPD